MDNRLQGKIDKGWGYEIIWATNDNYAGKLLVFEKVGSKFSMHFHREKDETWFVTEGRFKLRYIDTKTTKIVEKDLNEGDIWHNPPLLPHQLEALLPNSIIFEASTPDSVEDNYRIFPGDSQNGKI